MDTNTIRISRSVCMGAKFDKMDKVSFCVSFILYFMLDFSAKQKSLFVVPVFTF